MNGRQRTRRSMLSLALLVVLGTAIVAVPASARTSVPRPSSLSAFPVRTTQRRRNGPILAAADLNRYSSQRLRSARQSGRDATGTPFGILSPRGGGATPPPPSVTSSPVSEQTGTPPSAGEPQFRGGSTRTMSPSSYQKPPAAAATATATDPAHKQTDSESTTASTIASDTAKAPPTSGNSIAVPNNSSPITNDTDTTQSSIKATASTGDTLGHVELKKRRRWGRHKDIAKKLKNRNHTNLRRKVLHAGFGMFFCALNHFIPKAQFVPGMTLITSATLLVELLRYREGFGWMNEALHWVLGSSLRKHEMDGKFTGSFYYFLGVTTTAALYPKSCATLGILQLAIADPTASYFGRRTRHVYWSRIENGLGGIGRNKGILGFLGGALACIPFNYRLLSLAKFSAEKSGAAAAIPGGQAALLIASVALGIAGAFADLAVPTPTLTLPTKVCGIRVPPFHVDDNFVVPVVSGYACTKIFQALDWPQTLELARFMWF